MNDFLIGDSVFIELCGEKILCQVVRKLSATMYELVAGRVYYRVSKEKILRVGHLEVKDIK